MRPKAGQRCDHKPIDRHGGSPEFATIRPRTPQENQKSLPSHFGQKCDIKKAGSNQVNRKGFRTRRIILVTTLLDQASYSVQDLADLYCRRWQVELDIRSLKTHMQMEHLRCKSPSMVRKEIYAHMIAYNLVRDLIVITAVQFNTSPKHLSHTGAVQALNAFAEKLDADSDCIAELEAALLESIAEHPIGDRRPRVHPREIKRRPKPYKRMTQPRHAARRSAA